MNASELRIGNKIRVHSLNDRIGNEEYCEATVNSLGVGFIGYEAEKKYNHSSIGPIPLTEEWLGRMEFTREDEWSGIYLRVNDGLRLTGNAHGQVVLIDYMGREMLNVRCESVHQLQNLHFALTGKELKV